MQKAIEEGKVGFSRSVASLFLTCSVLVTALNILGWHLRTVIACTAIGVSGYMSGGIVAYYKCSVLIQQITERET